MCLWTLQTQSTVAISQRQRPGEHTVACKRDGDVCVDPLWRSHYLIVQHWLKKGHVTTKEVPNRVIKVIKSSLGCRGDTYKRRCAMDSMSQMWSKERRVDENHVASLLKDLLPHIHTQGWRQEQCLWQLRPRNEIVSTDGGRGGVRRTSEEPLCGLQTHGDLRLRRRQVSRRDAWEKGMTQEAGWGVHILPLPRAWTGVPVPTGRHSSCCCPALHFSFCVVFLLSVNFILIYFFGARVFSTFYRPKQPANCTKNVSTTERLSPFKPS